MDQSLSGALPFRGFQAGEILRPVAALMNQKAEEALSEPSDRWSVALTETLRRVLAGWGANCREPLPCISPNIHGIQKSRGAQCIKQDESART
jgi:hypothetical protein